MSNKIFDCITFYNANMLFDLRYHTLKDYVDFFVVCEANKTHTGKAKNYNFDKSWASKLKKELLELQQNLKGLTIALTHPAWLSYPSILL